jgi:putative peptide zinc metalloprotease protein
MAESTFSEHWHRVADQRIALRPTVQTRRQVVRGEKWFLVQEAFNNHFFRLSEGAHRFVCRLDGRRTVEEVWLLCLEQDPEGAPGQTEVIQLLSQLYQANLLRGEVAPDNARLFERFEKRQKRERRARFNFMSLRFPLFDPDKLLQRTLPLVRWLMTPFGAVLWIAVVGAAVKVAIEHAPQLRDQSEGVLSPGNLPLLYAALVFIKVIHEFGHAFACRRFGGEVHTMGVLLMYFSPVPYVDATASWAFRSKWRRIFVSSAGMIVELFVAALATFVWAATGEGALHSLAYNVMFIASVTTLFFNANPLMRFDGYYILSDLIEMPNLQVRSQQMLRFLTERFLFGSRSSVNPAQSRREGGFLAGFGIAGAIYRVWLFFWIALFVSERFLLLGILMALYMVAMFTVAPLVKFVRWVAADPHLARTRQRALLVSFGGLAVIVAVLALVPFPHRFRAPGVLSSEEFSRVFTQTPGTLREILAVPGSTVEKGAPLLRLESPELALEIAAARAELGRAVAEEERALERATATLLPLRARREVAQRTLRKREEQQRDLIVRAPHTGTWAAIRVQDHLGQFFPRGHELGAIVPSQFRFSAVVSQRDAAHLFSGNLHASEVRLAGQAEQPIIVEDVRVIPAEQEVLPSAALGWGAGGEIELAAGDRTGLRAAEPFFELRATLRATPGAPFLQGRSGRIRCELTPQPLLVQWFHQLRQLVQARYQI